MTLILQRDGISSFITIDNKFIPKIYTKSSLFKNETYELVKVEDNKAFYEFRFERSHEDN